MSVKPEKHKKSTAADNDVTASEASTSAEPSASSILFSNDQRLLRSGERFPSYELFHKRLEEHKAATKSEYWVRDCRTLKRANQLFPNTNGAPSELKYQYLKLTCVFGGSSFKSKSKNLRKFVGTFRQGCPAKILVRLSPCRNYLKVALVENSHNHPLQGKLKKPKIPIEKKKDPLDKLVVHNGYIYRCVPSSGKRHHGGLKTYLLCIKDKCPGRAWTMKDTDEIHSNKDHDHEMDIYAWDRIQFQKVLQNRAEKEALSYERIFQEESLNYPEVSISVNYEDMRQVMEERRSRATPPSPQNLQDLSMILVSDDWCNRFGCNLEDPPRELFIGAVRGASNSEISSVFASMALCQAMNRPISELHIDMSFKNLPERPGDIGFLMSIHFIEQNTSFCAVSALMPSCSLGTFVSVLKFVRDEVLPDCEPACIYTGHQAEIQIACREVFPGAEVEGSTFHFIKDVWERCQILQLAELPRRTEVEAFMHACQVLPLLPPLLMEAGLNAISATAARTMPELAPSLLQLVQHLRYSWIEAIGGSEISANSVPGRSNITLQNFHHEVDILVAKNQPFTIWKFINVLQLLEQSHREDYERLQRGEELPEERRSLLAAEDPRVVQATRDLHAGKIGIVEFLTAASCTVASFDLQDNQEVASQSDESGEDE